MHKLYLKVNENGVIAQTLFGNFKGEPQGFEYNFVVEDNEMIAELRNSTQDWWVRDNKLRKKELVKLKVERVKPEGSEDDVVRANGIDQYRITVQGCSLSEVDIWVSMEKMVLPTDDDLIITSKVPTMFRLEAKGVGYKMKKPMFLEFK